MSIFYIEDRGDKFLVKVDLRKIGFDVSKITGSWTVFEARIMGLSYADYLRMCRDIYGAEIIGKGNKYPIAFFSSKLEAQKLINVLEKRWNIIKEL